MAAYRQITSSPEKLLFSEVTDEGLSAPKQRWLRRSVHRGIQAGNHIPKTSEVETKGRILLAYRQA